MKEKEIIERKEKNYEENDNVNKLIKWQILLNKDQSNSENS